MIFGENKPIKCRDCKRVSTNPNSKKFIAESRKGKWDAVLCERCFIEENIPPMEYLEQFYFQEWFNSSMLNKKHLKLWRESKKIGKELEIVIAPIELSPFQS